MDIRNQLDDPLPADSLLLATNNIGKRREIFRLLEKHSLNIVTPEKLKLDLTVSEDGSSYAENAFLKAHAFAKAGDCLAIADDSGIEVKALGDRPGLYSARYGSNDLDDLGRVELMLEEMKNVPKEKRLARYVAAVILVWPSARYRLFEASWEGSIGYECRGTGGFGYDPIFVTSDGRTSAELTTKEKDLVSHRGKAVRESLKWLVG